MKLNKDQVLPGAEERITVYELSTITEEVDQESGLEQNQSSDVMGKYKGIIREQSKKLGIEGINNRSGKPER